MIDFGIIESKPVEARTVIAITGQTETLYWLSSFWGGGHPALKIRQALWRIDHLGRVGVYIP